MVTKSGKRPLSTKSEPSFLSSEAVFGNKLSISPDLKKELEDQGLAWRFVDAKKLYEMNGYHDKGWVVYKRKNGSGSIDKQEFKFGSDPDGVIRRGSLLLAVKSKEEAAKHRLYLDQRAQRHTAHNHEKAEELRKIAKENNLKATIHEGYEENEDE